MYRKKSQRICFFSYSAIFIYTIIAIVLLINPVNSQEDLKDSLQIINPRPDFDLSLRLEKRADATYAPGENIRIYFRSTRKAYVTIFGYDSYGNIVLLFPNQYQKDNLVEANKQYYIEGIIDPVSRPGLEYVQGFATTEQVIISRELERRIESDWFPILEGEITTFTKRINSILKRIPSQNWVSSEVLDYEVLKISHKTGQLRIYSTPGGAEIYLNDRYAGKTPLEIAEVGVGEYLARAELSGYEIWTKTVQIIQGRPTFVLANLVSTQHYGSIAIQCNEDNARIYLDGEYVKESEQNRNVLIEQVKTGSHDIEVILDGYREWSQRIEVKPNHQIQLTVNLERIIQVGNLEIASDIDNARIYLDDKYYANTIMGRSVIIDNIPEGNYELKIVKDGYHDYVTMVSIYSDRTNHLKGIILTEAETQLAQSENAYSIEDYTKAQELAEQARTTEVEINKEADNASSSMNYAKSAINQGKLKGVILTRAESLYTQSENAYATGIYSKAKEFAEQARSSAIKISKEAEDASSLISKAKIAIYEEEYIYIDNTPIEYFLESTLTQSEKYFKEGNYSEAYLFAQRAYKVAIDIDQDGIPNRNDFAPTIKNIYIYTSIIIVILILVVLLNYLRKWGAIFNKRREISRKLNRWEDKGYISSEIKNWIFRIKNTAEIEAKFKIIEREMQKVDQSGEELDSMSLKDFTKRYFSE